VPPAARAPGLGTEVLLRRVTVYGELIPSYVHFTAAEVLDKTPCGWGASRAPAEVPCAPRSIFFLA